MSGVDIEDLNDLGGEGVAFHFGSGGRRCGKQGDVFEVVQAGRIAFSCHGLLFA